MNNSTSRFSTLDSRKLKGVAILMMMWHHCFLTGRFEKFDINFAPLTGSNVSNIAWFMKICVSLFVFISGYGLFLSLEKSKESTGAWLKTRLIKVLQRYWFIVVLCWIVCQIINGYTLSFYFSDGHILKNLFNMAVELLGINTLLGNANFNGSWWYMYAAIIYVLLAPLMYAVLKKFGSLIFTLLIFIAPHIIWTAYPGNTGAITFISAFGLGMLFAKENVFERFHEMRIPLKNKKAADVLKFIICLILIFVCYKSYLSLNVEKWYGVMFGLMPAFIILVFAEYIDRIPVISHILDFLGKHSLNIFLIHGFVRYYYGESFIYGLGKIHFMVSMIVLLVISIIISYLINGLVKLTRYDKLVEKMINFKLNPVKEKTESN